MPIIIHRILIARVRLDVGDHLPGDGRGADVEVVIPDIQVIQRVHRHQRADIAEPIAVEVKFAQASARQRIQRREPVGVEGELVEVGQSEDKRHRLQAVVVQVEIPQVHQVGHLVEIHARAIVQVEVVQIGQTHQGRDAGQGGVVMEVKLGQIGQPREHRHARQRELPNAQIGHVGQAAEEGEADDARVVIEGKLMQRG